MSLAHRLAPTRRGTILRITAASLLMAAAVGCDGSKKRDQAYGTDAGSGYQGPPMVTVYYDASTTTIDAKVSDAPAADAADAGTKITPSPDGGSVD